MHTVFATIRHELRRLRRRPMPLIVLVFMPLVLMSFIQPLYRDSLLRSGNTNATGAELGVPGLTAMFAFFVVGIVGFTVYAEHGWGTWDRLRASPASPAAVLVGKGAPVLLLSAIQFVALFSYGYVVLGLRPQGSWLGLVLVDMAFAICLISFGFFLATITRDLVHMTAIERLGFLVFAGLGGAMVPVSRLPGWLSAVAPIVPTYWAVKGFSEEVLGGGGLMEIAAPTAVLLAFAGLFGALTTTRFRADAAKVGWE